MSARELSDEECDAIADDAYKSLPTPTPSLLIARRCLVRSIDRAAFAAGRAAGLEEAAQVVAHGLRGRQRIALAIRALAEGKAQPEGPL